ncbi:hypothetical protein MXD63_15130 [Frankia sp. Cpl3]|nr:hypothetical protein [Frankia sp. Cpl3]
MAGGLGAEHWSDVGRLELVVTRRQGEPGDEAAWQGAPGTAQPPAVEPCGRGLE